MLKLSRKIGERVVIDGDITVEVLEVKNGRVRLGFVAPDEVTINREEIERKIADGHGREVR